MYKDRKSVSPQRACKAFPLPPSHSSHRVHVQSVGAGRNQQQQQHNHHNDPHFLPPVSVGVDRRTTHPPLSKGNANTNNAKHNNNTKKHHSHEDTKSKGSHNHNNSHHHFLHKPRENKASVSAKHLSTKVRGNSCCIYGTAEASFWKAQKLSHCNE